MYWEEERRRDWYRFRDSLKMSKDCVYLEAEERKPEIEDIGEGSG